MKKILYIEANRDGTIGGSYYSLLYLLQGLDKSKYELHVLFCQENSLIPEYRKVTPHVYVNNFGPSGSAPARTVKDVLKWPYRLFSQVILKQGVLKKIIDEIKPDMVHLNNGYNAMHEWMLAGRLHGFKVITHDRGTRPPASLRTKIFVRFLDAIICVSESYKNNVINDGLKVKNLFRVYNGLDLEKMATRQGEGAVDALRKEFRIHEGEPTIGILGNIDRWKGQLVVLQAMERVRKNHPRIKCLIVGPVVMRMEPYKAELDKYIEEHRLEENVVFTGYRNDISDILDMLDVLVHASIEPEPFGRVILEGMAAAKPIVGTNSGGTPEQIIDGETGILVPMNDPDRMAEAILLYLSDMDKARSIGLAGRKRLETVFTIQNMVKDVEKIYSSILDG